MFQSKIVWIFLLHVCLCQLFDNKTTLLKDLNQCKLTHSGHEYQGTIAKTVGGVRCQLWFGEHQLHEVDVSIKDFNFPDGDRKRAKNYCRNPTSDENGPWCYTTDKNLVDDECNVPLCNFGECRISGTGAEYGGHRNFTYSGKSCLAWNIVHKLNDSETPNFSDKKFPDKLRVNAKKFCRNPNDDSGGPWCYVESDDYEKIEKEYCDIPFCDDKDCLTFTRETANYTTLTKMNPAVNNITIWIKLWNPNDALQSVARLLLSYVPIPTSAKKIAQDWRAGTEIVFSNIGSGSFYPNFESDLHLDYTPHILVGTKWTGLSISWAGGSITVSYYGSSIPIFTADYGTNSSYTNLLYLDSFLYYGLMANGPGVLWSTEFCQETCEVHITFDVDFLRLWPIHKESITNDIHFFVRADRNIAVQLYPNPGALFPRFTLTIGFLDIITLVYQETEESPKQYLRDLSNPEIINFFSFKEFYISIFGSRFHLYSSGHYGKLEILSARHDSFNAMRWFSVGSSNVIAYWTLYCMPAASDAVEKLALPNCLKSPTDYKYMGNQWTTMYQRPCIPWSSIDVPKNETEDNRFPDGSAVKALNQCRNPMHEVKGPYCYSLKQSSTFEIVKQYCAIQLCQSSSCRVAGTGNDYIGTLSKTRTGRTCAPWVTDSTSNKFASMKTIYRRHSNYFIKSQSSKSLVNNNKIKNEVQLNVQSNQIHHVDPAYLNDTLYPERSAKKAKNFCRDPSRSIGGPWCYTTDPLIPQDLCDVRDCDKDGPGVDRRQYILPEHRAEGLRISLKSWEPEHPDSLTFGFIANDGLRSRYILRVGAANNQQVVLFYIGEEGDLELVMTRTLPHLIYIGMWTDFIIRIPQGKVELYYEGVPNPIFQWTHPEPLKAFIPFYYYYTSDYSHTIAVSFDCVSKCTVEITETDELTRILPVTIRNVDRVLHSQKLVLIIRAKGVISIPLFLFPEILEYYGLKFDEMSTSIAFFKNTNPNIKVLYKEKIRVPTLYNETIWTNFTITWENNIITILRNSMNIFRYNHSHPLIFYYFSVIVKKGGTAKWTANCEPPDIDGPPEDGGWSDWSPWICSATCNGGIGVRKRVCNNPTPNIRGGPCIGSSLISGRCNTIQCGDITDDTINLTKQRLRHNSTALSVKEGQSVTISSDSDIISRVTHESPDSEIKWSHNGIFMDSNNSRINIEQYNIIIDQTKVTDSGIYTITVRRIDETYRILKIISLVVYPITDIITYRETQSMVLHCNCIVLGYLYTNLRILWLHNNKIWMDYGTTIPISVNIDAIPSINTSHQGLWECIVKQDDFNFYWITNAIKINVIDAPNWKSHLMEDSFTKPIFGMMPNENYAAALLIILIILLTLSIIIGTICFIKFKNRSDKRRWRYPVETRVKARSGEKSRKTIIKNVLEKFWKFSGDKTEKEEHNTLLDTTTKK